MFKKKQLALASQVQAISASEGYPIESIRWAWIPFSGNWGLAMSFFQIVAEAAKKRGEKINVGAKAQEIAEKIVKELQLPDGFERAEAVRGYLNVYFSSKEYARRVVDIILTEGAEFGRAPRTGRRTMVEFAQPNTHKAFHVGHLRNVIRSEEHTSELQSRADLVCRLLLEKKKL